MDALDLLSDDSGEDADAEKAEAEKEDEETLEESEAKRLKTSELDFSALQRVGYSAGTSEEDEAAAAAASFKNSCDALKEEAAKSQNQLRDAPPDFAAAAAGVDDSVEMSCEKPADWVDTHDSTGSDIPSPVKTWEEASAVLQPELLSPMQAAGFPAPTSIQAHSWPILASGRDLIGIAKTGSGKTLAFLLPCFAQILKEKSAEQASKRDGELDAIFQPAKGLYSPDIIVLAPSRELVSQIEAEALKFADAGITTACCYGGSNRSEQLATLRRRPHCIVATPGRLNDYIKTEVSWMTVDQHRYLILDEADRMLDDGFEPQIRGITGSAASSTRQGMLFSATWDDNVSTLASWVLRDPVEVRVGAGDALKANVDIDQRVEFCKNSGDKEGCLKSILRKHFVRGLTAGTKGGKGKSDKGKGSDKDKAKGSEKGKGSGKGKQVKRKKGEGAPDLTNGVGKVIVFCGDADTCDSLSKTLWKSCQLPSETLHADKHQQDRENALNSFHNGDPPILLATGVAGRGLDVRNVNLVVNYDAPIGPEDYVHRIGRTGRAGKKGVSITLLSLVTDGEAMAYIGDVMKRTGLLIPANLAEQLAMRHGRATRIERMKAAME